MMSTAQEFIDAQNELQLTQPHLAMQDINTDISQLTPLTP